MQLVIVESPSKAKTIEKYLKKEGNFIVRASVGHIRDLPKSSKNAVDIEGGYKPHYEISTGKTSVISELSKLTKDADMVYLATDNDREGEAISWHIQEVLKDKVKKLPNIKRITFNEVTEKAIIDSLKKPREIDMNLVEAQEARRVLDRLVGYDLSGLLWKKLRYGLSAGRVQSPALHILVEREEEIEKFESTTFFELAINTARPDLTFTATKDFEDREFSEDFTKFLNGHKEFSLSKITVTQVEKKPKVPFTTSSLQQAASNYLGFSPSKTMMVAQKLYEQGFITYMRTDSPALSKDALGIIKGVVTERYGAEMHEYRQFKAKSKNAQEAHEAIRPTNLSLYSRGSTEDEKRLYDLIWKRTIASQMIAAQVERTTATITVDYKKEDYNFSVTGSIILNAGYMQCDTYGEATDKPLPALKEGQQLTKESISCTEKHTEPPARYSEAGLVKELEKRGIGRPSTYASTISTLIERTYVEKIGRSLKPTDTGMIVSKFLREHFLEYTSDVFTAHMEDKLDDITDGKATYIETIDEMYKPLHKAVLSKESIERISNLGEADAQFKCPVCGAGMIIKIGKTGKFMSCSRYPDCTGALTMSGLPLGQGVLLGEDPKTKLPIYLHEGRYGTYVTIGDKDAEVKKASLGRTKPENVTLAKALAALVYPKVLGTDPKTGEEVFVNDGRYGPYVGMGKVFRPIKKPKTLETVTLEEAIKLLYTPKALPKGTELVRSFEHPKTGKEIRLLKGKQGVFYQKGLKRIYIPDSVDALNAPVEEILAYEKVK
ncbi:MAG TPA: type I DNA topoisomerase [Candidatus Paceibacterota bacterium]